MMSIRQIIRQALLASLALLLATGGSVRAQSEAVASTMAGTEFYVAFMKNEDKQRPAATRFMGLMITSEVATIGQVMIPGSDAKPFNTRPGQITTIVVDRNLEMLYGEEDPLPAIHITSRAPISVYVLNSLYQSSGGYAAVPVSLWDLTYTPMALPNADGERVSEFMVIAAHDSTLVRINPSARTNYKDPGQDLTVALRKGESYLVQAWPGISGVADLSTSEIRASRPVGVVSGHVRTPIAPNRNTPLSLWASHQTVMHLPNGKWGTEYFSVPTRQVPDRYRMTTESIEPATVEITHYPPDRAPDKVTVTIKHGQMYDSTTINGRPITGPVRWSSSKPIIVMQHRTSGPYGDAGDSPASFPLVALDRYTWHTTFVAPDFIGQNAITDHVLTIIAKGPATIDADDPNNPLRSILLDGQPLFTKAQELLTQQIGSSGLYYAKVTIDGGGHVLKSLREYPFTATVSGDNGNIGDFYSWIAPHWLPEVETDVTAPRAGNSLVDASNRMIIVRVTDQTPSYFSGVASVKVVRNNEWRLTAPFTAPYPDDDVEVKFTTSTDPSGPLYVELRDHEGNIDTVKISDGLCSKTAYADRATIVINGMSGSPAYDSVRISANPCGSRAIVQGIDLGAGNAKNYLTAEFRSAGNIPFDIPANNSAILHFTVTPNTPAGTYVTTVTITLDTSSITLPIQLNIGISGVAVAEPGSSMRMEIYPNPFSSTTRMAFGRPLGAGSQITIADYLGRTIRRYDAGRIAGRTEIAWDGLDQNGTALPAGIYYVTLTEGSHRTIGSATLVR